MLTPASLQHNDRWRKVRKRLRCPAFSIETVAGIELAIGPQFRLCCCLVLVLCLFRIFKASVKGELCLVPIVSVFEQCPAQGLGFRVWVDENLNYAVSAHIGVLCMCVQAQGIKGVCEWMARACTCTLTTRKPERNCKPTSIECLDEVII